MRTAPRVDGNQSAIVSALRAAGCTVQSLAGAAHGVPDLLVATSSGRTFLLEVKDGAKPPSARRLTSGQVRWHGHWNGTVHIVASVDAALALVQSNHV